MNRVFHVILFRGDLPEGSVPGDSPRDLLHTAQSYDCVFVSGKPPRVLGSSGAKLCIYATLSVGMSEFLYTLLWLIFGLPVMALIAFYVFKNRLSVEG